MYAQLATGATVVAGTVAVLLLVAAPTTALQNLGLAGVIYTSAAAVALLADRRLSRLENLGVRVVRAEHDVLNELRRHAPLN